MFKQVDKQISGSFLLKMFAYLDLMPDSFFTLSQVESGLHLKEGSRVRSHPGPIFFGRLIMKFLRSFSSLPLIQEGLLSVTSKRMCKKYWLTA